MTIYVPGKVTLRQTWQPMDSDAAAYITAVETADGQALEEKVKIAIDNFVLGCKADGIWSAINASCILAGARTLAGALVPLVGTAPTNYNFVAGDYNRETGLVGDGSTKYLDSNRNNNADPQDSQHFFCRVSITPTGTMAVMGAGSTDPGSSNTVFVGGIASYRSRNSLTGGSSTTHGLGGFGASRSVSASFSYLSSPGIIDTTASTSESPFVGTMHIFRRNAASALISDARLAFYSIGESLDLAKLDARVTDLINAIGVAIP